MSTQDKWAGRTWTLNDAVGDDGTDALSKVIMLPNGPNRFQLVPVFNGSDLLGYRVVFRPNEMMPCWNNCYLFIHGANPSTAPSSPNLPPLPLRPWQPAPPHGTPPYRADYNAIAGAIRTAGNNHPGTERIDGDIHPPGKPPEAVTLWQVPGVVSNKTFLSIAVRADTSPVGTRESGIAHGND
jgi:hypothetical protein